MFVARSGCRDRLPAGLGDELAEGDVLLEESTVPVVELGPGEVMALGGVVAEEAGEDAVGERPLHVLLDQSRRELLERRVHQEAVRLSLAECAAIEQVGVGHRPPPAPGVPVGLAAQDVQHGRQPAEPVGGRVGHHELAHAVDVGGDAANVFVGDQAAEDGRLVGVGREGQGRFRRGEVVAAEVQLIGDVAFAGIDILAVEVAVAVRPVHSLFDLRVPLRLEVGHLAGHTGHRVHAPDRPVIPGGLDEPGHVPPVAVVVAAGEECLGRLPACIGQAACLGQGRLDRPAASALTWASTTSAARCSGR